MKRKYIEALAERLLARSSSRLSCDQPEVQKDLKMAADQILLLAKSPDGFQDRQTWADSGAGVA
jgi:hypothetical protein